MLRVLTAFLVLFSFFIIPYVPASAADVPAQTPTAAREMGTGELQDMMDRKTPFFLLDVREQSEYDGAHIGGATLIPLSALPDRLAEVPKDKKIVVYCRSGRRSAIAAQLLKAGGFEDVASLSGGFQEWAAVQGARKYLACGETPHGACDKTQDPRGL